MRVSYTPSGSVLTAALKDVHCCPRGAPECAQPSRTVGALCVLQPLEPLPPWREGLDVGHQPRPAAQLVTMKLDPRENDGKG